MRHKFFIRTNKKSLKALTDQIIEPQEQEAWLHKLLEYDFTVEDKLGKVSLASDALSISSFMATSNPHHSLLQQIHDAVNSDPKLNPIKAQCLQGIATESHYHVPNSSLFWKSRLLSHWWTCRH